MPRNCLRTKSGALVAIALYKKTNGGVVHPKIIRNIIDLAFTGTDVLKLSKKIQNKKIKKKIISLSPRTSIKLAKKQKNKITNTEYFIKV